MFKQTIKYTDFNGAERVEDFYFHLSVPEVTRIQAEIQTGATNDTEIKDHIEKLTRDNNMKELLAFMEMVMLTSYGEKSSDGRTFIKTPELRREFEYSNAYAELFEMLFTDEKLARKFGEQVADNGKQSKDNHVSPKVVKD